MSKSKTHRKIEGEQDLPPKHLWGTRRCTCSHYDELHRLPDGTGFAAECREEGCDCKQFEKDPNPTHQDENPTPPFPCSNCGESYYYGLMKTSRGDTLVWAHPCMPSNSKDGCEDEFRGVNRKPIHPNYLKAAGLTTREEVYVLLLEGGEVCWREAFNQFWAGNGMRGNIQKNAKEMADALLGEET